jgi:hypothetical protein
MRYILLLLIVILAAAAAANTTKIGVSGIRFTGTTLSHSWRA